MKILHTLLYISEHTLERPDLTNQLKSNLQKQIPMLHPYNFPKEIQGHLIHNVHFIRTMLI